MSRLPHKSPMEVQKRIQGRAATELILAEVEAERMNQNTKHGGIANDVLNTESDWYRWIIEHLGFASRGIHAGKRQELIRVAALAVAAVEAYDRNGGGFPR